MEIPLRPGCSVSMTDKVKMETFKQSALAIGGYPTFKYNASHGGGLATITHIELGRVFLNFDIANLHIPSLTWRTGRFLGAPLPPIFHIDIVPSKLEGYIELASGEVHLSLSADFLFSAAGLYKVSLHVDTDLSTESAVSRHHNKTGQRLCNDGNAVLVGVGTVDATDRRLINKLLHLPTDVLGLMRSKFMVCQMEEAQQ